MKLRGPLLVISAVLAVGMVEVRSAQAQLRDVKEKITGDVVNEGIQKNIGDEIGAGRGSITTQNSSLYIIKRDPFRAIRRGRQLFQRKFLPTQGFSGRDRSGDIQADPSIGAGVVDSCAGCHSRPRGSAGFGGNVFTRPDSRDAPHLFGLGLQEMLGDEITTDLRNLRAQAIANAAAAHAPQTVTLTSKGTNYGSLTANPDGTVNTASVVGVDSDLRVKPFFAQGKTISMREFLVGAANAEMGIQSDDPDLIAASIKRQRVVTPSGMVLDGTLDKIEAPPVTGSNGLDPDGDGIANEFPVSLVDFMEFYLLNYFKPATSISPDKSSEVSAGRALFSQVGCASCHTPSLNINKDRRVADVETAFSDFNPADGVATDGNPLNRLFATATTRYVVVDDPVPDPVLKNPSLQPFVVQNFFADMKRHDLGPNFWERNFDGTFQKQFMTEPLWGVGSTAPYGHDGRSQSLEDVILRHGGEAQVARDAFAALSRPNKVLMFTFLNSLVLFAPDDTASNLSPVNPSAVNFPQNGHGAIALTVLFNDPTNKE